ncbi:hypothetical protein NA78x_000952 [Anatilimnocola sp. NA78]|uniref:hypothetical protein n=1 Tax=Anatilimnocola sp. NA78 TaxID=3415683 RepID=UPI003CE4A03F
MNRYSVVWHPDVEETLAKFALEHWGTSRLKEISQASNQIDRLLGERPLEVGSSSAANLRFLTIPPLTVLYAVFEDDRMVMLLEYRLLFAT